MLGDEQKYDGKGLVYHPVFSLRALGNLKSAFYFEQEMFSEIQRVH